VERRGRTGGIGRSAALIGVLTAASRVTGFGRILVFTWAVGVAALGDQYSAANTVPNIVFEIVAGGALASLVVPVVAAPLARGDRDRIAATTSALLTWVVTLLVPVAVVVALAADPIVGALVENASAAERAVGADMLRIFAPQLPLYGIGIVLSGLLQAHRRFAWPVLAPLLSSVTVAGAYLLFAAVDGRAPAVADLSSAGLLVLAGGTSLGVAVLTLCLVVPVRGLGLRLRPTYGLGDVAGPLRRLAIAGAVTVGAQQVCLALMIRFASGGPKGSLVLFWLAQTVFLLPWAVLAVPIATSAFPALADSAAAADERRFQVTTAAALRATLLVSAFGAALLVAVAPDAATVLAALDRTGPDPAPLAAAIAAFAPGLLGYGLFALLSRTLYARHAPAAAAGATVLGWAAVAVAATVLASVLPRADRVTAVAAANSVGMAVLGVALLVMVRRRAGAAALAGAGRAAAAGLVAGVAGGGLALAARTITMPDQPGVAAAIMRGSLGVVLVVVGFGVTAYALDRADLRPVVVALVGRVSRRRRAVDGTAREG
jgi:putative peptidoglycan lipid II flippase